MQTAIASQAEDEGTVRRRSTYTNSSHSCVLSSQSSWQSLSHGPSSMFASTGCQHLTFQYSRRCSVRRCYTVIWEVCDIHIGTFEPKRLEMIGIGDDPASSTINSDIVLPRTYPVEVRRGHKRRQDPLKTFMPQKRRKVLRWCFSDPPTVLWKSNRHFSI